MRDPSIGADATVEATNLSLAPTPADTSNEEANPGMRPNRGEGRRDRAPRRERRPDISSPVEQTAETAEAGSAHTATPEAGDDTPRYSYFSTPAAPAAAPANASPAAIAPDAVATPQDAPGTADAATASVDAAPTGDADDAGQSARAPREKRSRDRYGRDRRERSGTRQRGDEGIGEAGETDQVNPAPVTEPVAATAAQPTAPVVAASAVALAAMNQEPARRLPAVQTYLLPLQDLQAIAQGAGLEWVGSDADKIAQVQAAIAATPAPIHVPRERQAVVVVDEGPLVLVETRKDLSAMSLPFDKSTS